VYCCMTLFIRYICVILLSVCELDITLYNYLPNWKEWAVPPGPKDLLVSSRASWGILPQTTVFSLRSARRHWHSSKTALIEDPGPKDLLVIDLTLGEDPRRERHTRARPKRARPGKKIKGKMISRQLRSCTNGRAPSEARKRVSGGGSPRKHD
jgi:hypothetical protein